ncbi:TPA: DUF2758 domain-containing protein [Streptococcus suis]
MKIKLFKQTVFETVEEFEKKVNAFCETVEVIDIQVATDTHGSYNDTKSDTVILVKYR